ncbi:uncharacterized protein LOC112349442 [Selaginella moellendorffii]|uniref:uncharacterized protein LOC112349442 n=1 Tax=Selaginella moellendorffii TaxID=88036 RepID=UPI000D1C6ADF|nr:uncharacterized protein LOC112349442 [Selaginella moellendorffii]|eukprot:XP_024539646.1 uncharacterized protein LOC112349442 [Selaginella moellendorffii]
MERAMDTAPAPYEAPRSFQRVEAMQPLLDEALDPNKELWLLRLPDLDLEELSNTSWRLKLEAADGNMGHLVCNGVKYSFQRHDIQGSSKYAYVPTQDKIEVRPVPVEVSIVRSVEPTIAHPVAAENVDAAPNPAEEIASVGAVSDQERSGITRESSKRSKSLSKKRSQSEGGESSKGKRSKLDLSK